MKPGDLVRTKPSVQIIALMLLNDDDDIEIIKKLDGDEVMLVLGNSQFGLIEQSLPVVLAITSEGDIGYLWWDVVVKL